MSGTAVLTSADEGSFRVVVRLDRPIDGEAAVIHNAPCREHTDARRDETAFADLGPVRRGRAESTVFSDLADVQTGRYSVAVYPSDPSASAVGCGDILQR